MCIKGVRPFFLCRRYFFVADEKKSCCRRYFFCYRRLFCLLQMVTFLLQSIKKSVQTTKKSVQMTKKLVQTIKNQCRRCFFFAVDCLPRNVCSTKNLKCNADDCKKKQIVCSVFFIVCNKKKLSSALIL